MDQESFRFQFPNQSERSPNKWTSYVCVSKKGAVAYTCSCPSHKTEYKMWKSTPQNYNSFLLGPEDGAMTNVNIVCPFKGCHQASNLEYLRRCVMKREQVPRLVKAKERQAAVAASTTDTAAFSPADSDLTTEFASPDSPPTKLSPEQVRQVQEKTSYLKALARGIMAVGGMPMTPSPMEGRTGGRFGGRCGLRL